MFSQEQIKQIKAQLIQQIESTFPEDRRSEAISQIDEMDDEQLVEFLKQNNLINEDGSPAGGNAGAGKCIFCSIVYGDIPSTKIGENEKAIAILELNPVSKGHTLIIPKEHIESPDNIPEEAKQLGQEIAIKLQKTFKPKKVDVASTNLFGHEVINLIPVYENENINSPKKASSPEELAKVKSEIEATEPAEETPAQPVEEKKEVEEINEKNTWLPIRIP